MEYYQSPVPCKRCKATYVLPKKYEDTHVAIRDYCIECYCLKWEELEEQRAEGDIKEEVDSNI